MPAYHFIEDILNPYSRETAPDKRTSTLKVESVCIDRLAEFFSGCYISASDKRNVINGSLVRQYRERRKNEGVSPLTVKRELAVASRAVNYAISEWDYDIPNPFDKRLISSKDAKAVRHVRQKRIVTPQEEIRLLTAADPMTRDLIVFAINTGLRLGEICGLTRDQIDGDEIEFKPDAQKNGKYGRRGMNSKALAVVERQPEVCEFVFTKDGRKLREREVQKAFAKARDSAGLEDIRFKDLRKTCGSRMLAVGRMEDAKTQLGHSDIRTTQASYAEDSIDAAKAVLEAI